jgi:general secretion pathway protein G
MQDSKMSEISPKELFDAPQVDHELIRTITRHAQHGMTLIEIMIVVVIMGMVTGVIGVQVFGRLEEAKVETTRTQIKQISDALDLYRLSLRNYPSTAEGLPALTAPKGNVQPFMSSIPEDAWGSEFVYIYPGTQNSGGFDIMSYGKDGVQGGGDDIGNWKSAEQ